MSQPSVLLKYLSVFIFATFILTACSKLPDEEAINLRIENILEGLNSKDSGLVLDQLSPDFSGSHNLDRQNVRRMMALYFLRHKSVDVVLTHQDTTINGTTATTQGTALLAGRDTLLPESARVVRMSALWEQYDGEWLLRKLEWE